MGESVNQSGANLIYCQTKEQTVKEIFMKPEFHGFRLPRIIRSRGSAEESVLTNSRQAGCGCEGHGEDEKGCSCQGNCAREFYRGIGKGRFGGGRVSSLTDCKDAECMNSAAEERGADNGAGRGYALRNGKGENSSQRGSYGNSPRASYGGKGGNGGNGVCPHGGGEGEAPYGRFGGKGGNGGNGGVSSDMNVAGCRSEVSENFTYDKGNAPYAFDISGATAENENYRTVLWTGKHLQLTVMSIPVGEETGIEMHPDLDQFVRIESGEGEVVMGRLKSNLGYRVELGAGFGILIPAGTYHNIVNTGNVPLKLYSVYTPKAHPFGTVDVTRADAEKRESEKKDKSDGLK